MGWIRLPLGVFVEFKQTKCLSSSLLGPPFRYGPHKDIVLLGPKKYRATI